MKNENLFALIDARLPRDLGGRFLETLDSLAYSWRDLLHATGRLAGWLASLQLPAEADASWCRWKSRRKRCCSTWLRCAPAWPTCR